MLMTVSSTEHALALIMGIINKSNHRCVLFIIYIFMTKIISIPRVLSGCLENGGNCPSPARKLMKSPQ